MRQHDSDATHGSSSLKPALPILHLKAGDACVITKTAQAAPAKPQCFDADKETRP
jgi:hypothetical protein